MSTRLSIGLICLGCFLPTFMEGRSTDLLPKPQSLELFEEQAYFALGRPVAVEDPTDCILLKKFLETNQCVLDPGADARIRIVLCSQIEGAYDYPLAGFDAEAYRLRIEADQIVVHALSETGVIRAVQTLQQLAEGYEPEIPRLESLEISDWPAFKLRGIMHDVGRSFVTIEELKKEIDLLSRFKINVFHWHLTEKLAWRFEVKAFPQLTAAENMSRYPGYFYTQEECRELQDYAAERGVVIIPEIDMPGHSDAFRKAMGFDMQSDEGVEALKLILNEVIQTFSTAPYIHIGGDEVRITYPDFLETMAGYVRDKGRKVVVWNRLVSGAPSADVADMTQMWASSSSKVAGLPNIDCRYNYINHFDVYADVVGIYKSNIYYEPRGNEDVAGTITAIWNDTKTETQTDIICQNNLYANVLASAERAWIGGGKQYIETGGTHLPNSGEEYEEFADWERRFLFHKQHALKNEPVPYVRQCNVRWRITDPFPNGGDPDKVFPPETDRSSLLPTSFDYEGEKYFTTLATGAGIYLKHIWHPTVPSFFDHPENGQTAYAWTYVYSPVAQQAGAQIEFYTYSRSGNEKAPEAGCWDRRGSRIWVNDEEISAPEWKQPGKNILQDHGTEGLTNENLTARDPVLLSLKQGWNRVFLKLPHASNGGTGRDKWQFTFVLTDPEGRNALDGLIYSPSKSMDDSVLDLTTYVDSLSRYLSEHFGTEPGYYAEEMTVLLREKLENVYDSLSLELSEEDRMRQKRELEEMMDSLKQVMAVSGINQPLASTDAEEYWYVMHTPLRGDRYLTSHGAGEALVGETVSGRSAAWKFEKRTDGGYNIINASDGTYISPDAAENSALRTVSAEPDFGWTISVSDETGLVIVTSGSSQLNQTNNAAQGYQIYNWGGGNNKTDTGCKYQIEAIELPVYPEVSTDKVFYWYEITTPLRDRLAVTSQGKEQPLVGMKGNGVDASLWKLTEREDGSFNLVNRNDGTFISPDSPENSALSTVAEEPETGWMLSPAETEGYYIITSGQNQMNQTNSGLAYRIYNWGGGKNTTDTGCQFAFFFMKKEDMEATDVMECLPDEDRESVRLEDKSYFTLDGRVVNPESLTKGIYLVRSENRVCKLLIR